MSLVLELLEADWITATNPPVVPSPRRALATRAHPQDDSVASFSISIG